MTNPFTAAAEICNTSNMKLEASIYNEIAEYFDKHGAEETRRALNACIDAAIYICESWMKLFYLNALQYLHS